MLHNLYHKLVLPLLLTTTDFLFPRTCIACLHACEKNRDLLCAHCFSDLSFISPFARCHLCFEIVPHTLQTHRCPFRPLGIERHGFCFERSPPLIHLLHFFKNRGGDLKSCASLASFFAIQYFLLRFPKPDVLILLPSEIPLLTERPFAKELMILLHISQCAILNLKKQRLEPFFQTKEEVCRKALCISELFNPQEAKALIPFLRQYGIQKFSWLSLYEL